MATKVWAVYDAFKDKEVGIFIHEDEALLFRKIYLEENDVPPEDVHVETFTMFYE